MSQIIPLEDVFSTLRANRISWLQTSQKTHVDQFSALGQLWARESPWYKKVLELDAKPFSRVSVERGLDALARVFERTNLENALKVEVGWSANQINSSDVAIYPLGVVTQVLPGNHIMTGIMALVQCLLTRNSVILKLPQNDRGFVNIFVESLKSGPYPSLLDHIYLLPSKHADARALATIKTESDGIIVWGSGDAVAAFPQHECTGKVIYHGPRLGLGLIQGLPAKEKTLRGFAWDIALFEQLACSSPRVIFVKDEFPFSNSIEFSRRLDAALIQVNEATGKTLPNLDDKSEILSIRQVALWTEGQKLITGSSCDSHSVIWSEKVPVTVPVGFRTVYVVPIQDETDLLKNLVPLRGFLQTMTFDYDPNLDRILLNQLIERGISQFFRPGSGIPGNLGFPHEGEFPLRRLVKFVGFGGDDSVFGRPKK